MKDHTQRFIINSITRGGIAEVLRDMISCGQFKAMNGKPQELTNDDDRLTDEICQAYADALGFDDDPSNSEEYVEELEHEAAFAALEALGYRQLEEQDYTQEHLELIEQIAECERNIALKRKRIKELEERISLGG